MHTKQSVQTAVATDRTVYNLFRIRALCDNLFYGFKLLLMHKKISCVGIYTFSTVPF